MPSVQETATGQTPLAAALSAGVTNISYGQKVTFNRYIRMVLPLDGFVFWVRASLASGPDSSYNSTPHNTVPNNQSGGSEFAKTMIAVEGSLHETTNSQQNEDGSPAINTVVFTSKSKVEEFNEADPNVMWIGDFDGKRFALNESTMRYLQAGLFHYKGRALITTFDTQVIDSAQDLQTMELVVSNSLPIWLALYKFMPIYPSFAVPQNIKPPYAAVHIDPTGTAAIQAAPLIDITGTHWQLTHDTVKIDIYGLRNSAAMDYMDYVLNDSLADDAAWGLMNMPIIQDEKVQQTEFQILAQRKTFTLEVSYYQARVQNIARQMITSCLPTVIITEASLS